jgi:hypothetical protein
MLALDYLGSRNQWRLSLRKRGEEAVDGRKSWTIGFEEKERPTLVRTPLGRSRQVHGVVWVDPEEGAVLRTELAYDRSADESPAASITVRYRRESTLDLLVPYEMQERYVVAGRGGDGSEINALATYTKFRQFRASGRIVTPN